jgi:hypothetical protein
MGDQLKDAGERAIALVVEAQRPLCRVDLRIHDERTCRPCCRYSYIVSSNRLDVAQCPTHGRRCEHWQVVWAAR